MRLFAIFFLVLVSGCLLAQQPTDTVKTKKNAIAKKAFKTGMGYISTSQKDTIVNESSVDKNKIYERKIIRKIYLQHFGFERSIYDTTKRTRKIIADVADALHGTTREWVVRQHIFLKKNTPLNPHLLADNERFIRDLDFILDCRIVVVPIPDQPDSVDVSVITRDVFSLGMRVGGTIPTAPRIGIYDANLAGYGQRLDFTALVDGNRDPTFTYAAFYRKSSAFGSFANVELGFTQLNTGRSYGDESEYAYYVRVNRPLVSPYSRLAGGFEFSQNWSQNVNQSPDSVFLSYHYKIADSWLGYNFGMKKNYSNRNRIFLAGRFFDGVYLSQPEQEEYQTEPFYNNVNGYLAELTFYRQDFYRTRYVFGFGRTEDVPYGMSLSFAAGYVRLLSVERPYAGTKFRYSVANRKGNFYIFDFQGASYLRAPNLEDAVILTTVSYFTRALNFGEHKMRGLLVGGYAKIVDRRLISPLEIHDSELIGFSADSVWGSNKVFARMEASLYTPWQLLGFRFAPFLGASAAWMDCYTCEKGEVGFIGISGGVRTRNENLIFGTMELRASFIPSTGELPSQFSVNFRQRIRIKSSGSFVRAPSLISY